MYAAPEDGPASAWRKSLTLFLPAFLLLRGMFQVSCVRLGHCYPMLHLLVKHVRADALYKRALADVLVENAPASLNPGFSCHLSPVPAPSGSRKGYKNQPAYGFLLNSGCSLHANRSDRACSLTS